MNNFLEDDNCKFKPGDSVIETLCLDNSTFAQELGQDSHSQENYSEISTCADTLKLINGASTSSRKDSQESKISEMLENSQQAGTLDRSSISFPDHLHANLSQNREKREELTTLETVSQQSTKSSELTSQNSLQLKTSADYSTLHYNQTVKNLTSLISCKSFPAAGMMSNGLVYAADILPAPILEKEFCWLDSPGALSSLRSREPGQSKQEAGLKKLGLLKKGEVLNPELLCEWSKLPKTYLDPSESQTALDLFEQQEKQQEICLIGELPQSPYVESFTSIPLLDKNIHTVSYQQQEAVNADSKKPETRHSKGCLYKYLETKKLKSGAIAKYPRIECDRNPNNPEHWRWGFNWEEKVGDKWKGRSIGSIPASAVDSIKSMQENSSLEEIIKFIKGLKRK